MKTSKEKEIEELFKHVSWIAKDGQFDYSKYPIEHPLKDSMSTDNSKFRNACNLINSMIQAGRNDALVYLFGLFEYYRHDIRKLEVIADRLEYITNPLLITFLFKKIKETPSNNTNRVFINLIIKKLSHCKADLVIDDFCQLRDDKTFSYKMKQKFEEIIYKLTNQEDW